VAAAGAAPCGRLGATPRPATVLEACLERGQEVVGGLGLGLARRLDLFPGRLALDQIEDRLAVLVLVVARVKRTREAPDDRPGHVGLARGGRSSPARDIDV